MSTTKKRNLDGDDAELEVQRAALDVRTVDLAQLLNRLYLRFSGNAAAAHEFLKLVFVDVPVSQEKVQERFEAVAQARGALEALLKRPSIAQRTPEWYEARQGLITASDIAQALGLGKFGTQKQLIWKKCSTSNEDGFAALANCPPIKWGVMYEDVAQRLYCKRNGGVRIHEFGLLRHPTIAHLGASPDGITELGVMLEIKCPYRRQIDGKIPLQYYYQIQGQLEVCGLEECDYLEVKLEELGRDAFYAYALGEDALGEDALGEFGVVAEFVNAETGKSEYEYSGVDWPVYALERFEESARGRPLASGMEVRMHYYVVRQYSCVRVSRDAAFVERMKTAVEDVWRRIEAYRADPELLRGDIGEAPPAPAPTASRKSREEASRGPASVGDYVFRT